MKKFLFLILISLAVSSCSLLGGSNDLQGETGSEANEENSNRGGSGVVIRGQMYQK